MVVGRFWLEGSLVGVSLWGLIGRAMGDGVCWARSYDRGSDWGVVGLFVVLGG